MFDVVDKLEWTAVLAAFLAYFIIGGLWFTALFGKPYQRSLGRPSDAPPATGALLIAGPAICTLVVTVASAVLIAALGVDTTPDAITYGLVVSVGLLAANTFTIAINPNIPRPLFYGSISAAYHVVGFTLNALILVALS